MTSNQVLSNNNDTEYFSLKAVTSKTQAVAIDICNDHISC